MTTGIFDWSDAITTGELPAAFFCPTVGVRAVNTDSLRRAASVASAAAPNGSGRLAAETGTTWPDAIATDSEPVKLCCPNDGIFPTSDTSVGSVATLLISSIVEPDMRVGIFLLIVNGIK
jgi:hypothetical protein